MFQNGQVVESRVDAQGMKVGERFRVMGQSVRYALCFKYTTFELEALEGNRRVQVGNAHLVLRAVV